MINIEACGMFQCDEDKELNLILVESPIDINSQDQFQIFINKNILIEDVWVNVVALELFGNTFPIKKGTNIGFVTPNSVKDFYKNTPILVCNYTHEEFKSISDTDHFSWLSQKFEKHGYLLVANTCDKVDERFQVLAPNYISREEINKIQKTFKKL